MTTVIDKKLFIQPGWPAPACIKAYTSLRASKTWAAQEQSSPNSPVPGNVDRDRLKRLLSLPTEPVWLNQTHSVIALKAHSDNNGKVGDAVFSHEKNQVCAVITADCLPILLCDRKGTYVAAIHAGWRGLANGIIEATVQSLPLPATETLAWLGPAIGPQKFEVRQDVYDAFTHNDAESRCAFKAINDQQWLCDLYTLARIRLKRLGITAVYGGEHCTYSDEEHFYSYRREGKMTGRIVSLIWIADSL